VLDARGGDGKLIDKPVLLRAQALLQQAGQ
jgi:hypothetical protein